VRVGYRSAASGRERARAVDGGNVAPKKGNEAFKKGAGALPRMAN
jgi:hypothetical protein